MPVNELTWPHSTSSTTEKMRWITRAVIMNDETAQHILDAELHGLIRKYSIINLVRDVWISLGVFFFLHSHVVSSQLMFFKSEPVTG